MKVYTKTGDRGTTSLFGGALVEKNSVRIAAYGTVDELNSLIGMIIADDLAIDVSKKLARIQAELMVLGSNLATPKNVGPKIPKITMSYTTRLEKEIDTLEKRLSPLKNFILPGGGRAGAKLHLARAVCRRAERLIVMLDREEKLNPKLIIYINRLSDWFFVAARYTNKLDRQIEQIWKGRSK